MPFKITITETKAVRKMQNPQWEQVSQDAEGLPVYGYTPEVEITATEQRDVLIQEVDNLDLVAVIRAVNRLI